MIIAHGLAAPPVNLLPSDMASLSQYIYFDPVARGAFVFPEGPAVAGFAFDSGGAGHGGRVVPLAIEVKRAVGVQLGRECLFHVAAAQLLDVLGQEWCKGWRSLV